MQLFRCQIIDFCWWIYPCCREKKLTCNNDRLAGDMDDLSDYVMVYPTAEYPPASIYDLTPELLHRVMARENLFMFRVVCKSMKILIEQLPVFEITLSPKGTAEATSYFFSHFKGNLTVTSKRVSRAPIAWFLALMDSVKHGAKVEKASTLCINSGTASALSKTLERVLANSSSPRIPHISI